MLMILLIAVSQEPRATETDQFKLLGQSRADFGDKPLPKEYSVEEWEIWRMHTMPGHNGPTDMFFPEGAYDRRFYLQPFGAEHWLVYMTKTGEADDLIRFRWKIQLSKDIPDEMPLDLGTLEMMLYRRGLRVVDPVPTEAWHSLKARKGFAAYSNWPGPGFGFFKYWYVQSDGTSTEYAGAHDDLLFPAEPRTPFPYPITAEEKSALTTQGWKYRPPQSVTHLCHRALPEASPLAIQAPDRLRIGAGPPLLPDSSCQTLASRRQRNARSGSVS